MEKGFVGTTKLATGIKKTLGTIMYASQFNFQNFQDLRDSSGVRVSARGNDASEFRGGGSAGATAGAASRKV